MMNGIVAKRFGLIYYFTPKVMCTSLKVAFAKELGIPFKNPHAASFEMVSLSAKLEGLTTFAVVRNPFARFVSLYCDKIRKGYRGWGFPSGVEQFVLGKYGLFNENMTFKQFATVCLKDIPKKNADPHFAPQSGLVGTELRYYFKMEELNYLFWFLQKKGLDVSKIGRHNPNPKNPNTKWMDFYHDPEIIRLVEEYYMDDFINYNYKKLSSL